MRCTGKVQVEAEHEYGSERSMIPCTTTLAITCDAPPAARCYWNPPEHLDGLSSLTAAQLTEAQIDHDLHAARQELDQ